MATVFMKWLETNPQRYDRGIQILTLGRLHQIKEQILQGYVQPGMRVLEIGCGTGTLTMMMANRGAAVTGIDASPTMLAEAQKKVADQELDGLVTLHYMDATLIAERFPAASFDLIVSTLVFSELPADQQEYILEACAALLAPGGMMLVADEVIPKNTFARLSYYLFYWPLALLTWLLTRTTTNPLRDFDRLLARVGFESLVSASHLIGSLVLYETTLPLPLGSSAITSACAALSSICGPCFSASSHLIPKSGLDYTQ
jgi:demethylmenaquinone methyltransferase/2-methoxy-6-polyprenyl-1,4-benzoquinol methylase